MRGRQSVMLNIKENTLFTGDNLYILNGINSECVDLIYLDPPFNSKRLYEAPVGSKAAGTSFKDMWTWQDVDEGCLEKMVKDYPYLVRYIQAIEAMHDKAMMSYITYMTQRLIELHRILKPAGSLYLHCDQTASHYLKLILDRIFGAGNFRNELIWIYEGRELRKTSYNAKHDTLLLYSKGKKMTFNWEAIANPLKQSSRKALERFVDKDGRPYLLRYKSGGGFAPKSKEGGDDVYRQYVQDKVPPRDWIKFDYARKGERTGYPTQKPLELLHHVIKASSNKGDVVLDPFCGCATTMVAAQQLARKWVGIDISRKSADLVAERLPGDNGSLFTDFIHRLDMPVRTDVEIVKETDKSVRERLYREQGGKCNGCNDELDIRHYHLDHITPKSKGGGDYYENYQLLCGNCNSVKGNRPMEYLRAVIKRRNEAMDLQVSFGA